MDDRFETWASKLNMDLAKFTVPLSGKVVYSDLDTDQTWQAWQEAARQERERLDAIERMGPNGTIRIDDERGLCPKYVHWGGSTGLTLREAIDTVTTDFRGGGKKLPEHVGSGQRCNSHVHRSL